MIMVLKKVNRFFEKMLRGIGLKSKGKLYRRIYIVD